MNGRTGGAAKAGQYAVIERSWKQGDVVDVVVPQPLRAAQIDESHPEVVALMRGPVMYVGLNPWEGLSETPVELPKALKLIQGQSDRYVMNAGGKDLVFVPYFDVQLERYTTYFRTV